MSYKTVIYQKDDTIARVTLNRPEVLNAYSIQMRDDLYEIFTAVRDDPDVRVMIISGAGRAYCAGADLSEFGTTPSPVIARSVRWARDVWGVLRNMNKITVVAMHGHALGSGLELAMMCDLRLAAEGTRFGLPETSLGFIPAAGGTQSLPRGVKAGTALAMVLSSERIDATEALRIRLVNRVVPAGSLMAEAEALAQRVLSGAPLAVGLVKEAMNRGLDLSLEQGLDGERRLADLIFATSDAWEGLRAQVEGREALFRGK
ncbi:MAG: enoyl-CoA hydratase/isomerase family protein [Chloroflexota bacterium]|nr:MAG: enoyl-CoA hydratase/isomerase family protein [Chloroflexota bacterium]